MIDAYGHIVSANVHLDPMKSAFRDDSVQAHVVPFSAEELLAAQRSCGVAGAILVQFLAAYGYENGDAADVAADHPDRFVYGAGIDQAAPDPLDRARDWGEERGACEDLGCPGLWALSGLACVHFGFFDGSSQTGGDSNGS